MKSALGLDFPVALTYTRVAHAPSVVTSPSTMILTVDAFSLSLFDRRCLVSNYTHTPIQYISCVWHEYFSHSHGVNCFQIPLCWLCVAVFFCLLFPYDIMKSAFLSVPTIVVHPFHRTHNHIHTRVLPLPCLRVYNLLFGLNCRNSTISPVNHPWSFLRLHCSLFSRLCVSESSPTMIFRDAFRLRVIARIAPRIRKRKGRRCISDT